MKMPVLLCAASLVCGCDAIPKDPEGTLDRVRSERAFKVGLVASAQPPAGRGRQQLLIKGISGEAGASPLFEDGASELLLAKLEQGELDLVMGEMAPASPWAKMVTLMPIGEQVSRDGHVHLVVAARNGENDWIDLVHRQARAVAALP